MHILGEENMKLYRPLHAVFNMFMSVNDAEGANMDPRIDVHS